MGLMSHLRLQQLLTGLQLTVHICWLQLSVYGTGSKVPTRGCIAGGMRQATTYISGLGSLATSYEL